VFDLLTFLLAERDRVVAREEILDAVWGDQFVSESARTSRIKEARPLCTGLQAPTLLDRLG